MKKEKIYLAGKMFKDGDIKQRLYEEQIIREECKKAGKEIELYNPINNDDINDKTDDTHVITANDIFVGDNNQVLSSDIVFMELDDEDPGTINEVGIASGINFIYDLLDSGKSIDEIRKLVPRKTIYAHLSDIRQDSKGYEGKYLPWGINQFVVGGIEFNGHGQIFRHAEDIAKVISNRVED